MKFFRKLRPRLDAFLMQISPKHKEWVVARKERQFREAERRDDKYLNERFSPMQVAAIHVLRIAEKNMLCEKDVEKCQLLSQYIEHGRWDDE